MATSDWSSNLIFIWYINLSYLLLAETLIRPRPANCNFLEILANRYTCSSKRLKSNLRSLVGCGWWNFQVLYVSQHRVFVLFFEWADEFFNTKYRYRKPLWIFFLPSLWEIVILYIRLVNITVVYKWVLGVYEKTRKILNGKVLFPGEEDEKFF